MIAAPENSLPIFAVRRIGLGALIFAVNAFGCSGSANTPSSPTSASSASSASTPASRKPFTPCNNTQACQAQIQARDQAFAKAIADEPISPRLNVTTAARTVMVDVERQQVFLLDPTFATLDLQTGKELRRIKEISGDEMWRAGMWLVTTSDSASTQATMTFIDPAKPNEAPKTCSPKVPMPPEAANVLVHPFDRAGKIYFYWQSSYHYRGGAPPNAEIKEQEVKAEACGVMKLDVATCTAQSVPFDDFLWEPPEGRLRQQGEKKFCPLLSPLRDIPAAAASAAPVTSGNEPNGAVSRAPVLAIKMEKDREEGKCGAKTRVTLEARDESAKLRWSHELAAIPAFCQAP